MSKVQKSRMRVYISGPMTGIPEFNRPAFIKAKCKLIALGYDVISPVDVGDELAERMAPTKPNWTDYMRDDIRALVECEAIYLLDGWDKSKGATAEKRIADDLGIPSINNIIQGADLRALDDLAP
jgi:hypothetical protein